MEIKFISRENVINNILDEINKQRKIDDELKQILIDFSKTLKGKLDEKHIP